MLVDKTISAKDLRVFTGKVLVCSDLHIPYHDTEAVNALMRLLRSNKFHTIILNGDMIDCTRLSTKFHNPTKTFFDDELEIMRQFISMIKYESKNPKINIMYNLGNHENRMNKYLAERAPELYNVFTPFEKILDVDGIDICGSIIINDGLIVKHGNLVRKDCGQTAMGEMLREFRSGVSGHTHRLCRVHYRTRDDVRTWIECGCLCDCDPIYADKPNWQQGIAVLEYKTKELIRSMAIPLWAGSFDYIQLKGVYQNEIQQG